MPQSCSDDQQGQRGCTPSKTQLRLRAELLDKGVAHTFIRVGPDYYSRSLQERQNILAATSTQQLCKSMVMENTKAPASAQRFYLVIVQYVSAIQAELLKKYVLSVAVAEGRTLTRSQCNMRLASEADSERLTGYVHNAVSPVGLHQQLPLILAAEIAELSYMWLGGGEPDLKLGMSVPNFITAYQPAIVDCSNQRRTTVST